MIKDSSLMLYPQQTTRTLGLLLPHPFLQAPITTTLSLSQLTLTNNAHNRFFAAARPRSRTLHSHFLHNRKGKKQPLIMGMKKGASDHDDVVLKSPNDRRLYRLLRLPNGLRALLVHDPEIYPEGPPKHAPEEDEVDEGEEDEDDEEGEGEYDDEDDDDDEEEEGDDDDGERDGVKGGGAAAQSKKVGFLFVFFCVLLIWGMPISILATVYSVLLLWLCGLVVLVSMGSGFCVEMWGCEWGLGNGYAICDSVC